MYKWILLLVPALFFSSCGGGMEWKRPLKEEEKARKDGDVHLTARRLGYFVRFLAKLGLILRRDV